MKKKISMKTVNQTSKEAININCTCIFNKNKIKYIHDSINYSIIINKNNLIITRENKEFLNYMIYQNNKNTLGNYLLKENNMNFDLNIKTEELIIKENNIYIKYKILESKNIFEISIEMEDI